MPNNKQRRKKQWREYLQRLQEAEYHAQHHPTPKAIQRLRALQDRVTLRRWQQ